MDKEQIESKLKELETQINQEENISKRGGLIKQIKSLQEKYNQTYNEE